MSTIAESYGRWSDGFDAGQAFTIEHINKMTNSQFKDAVELVMYINEPERYKNLKNPATTGVSEVKCGAM
jgi:hypothetical protein